MVRTTTATCLLALMVTLSHRALADGGKAECIAAYESGQRARKSGALSKAKQAFEYCASESCPSAMHDDCSSWLHEVDDAIPTRAFRVTDGNGEPLPSATLSIDGGEAQELSEEALSFEPGSHELTFECDGYAKVQRRLVLRPGEHAAPLDIELEPLAEVTAAETAPEAPPRPKRFRDSSSPNWIPTLIGAGVGVLGTASFTYFGLRARSLDRSLDECIPNCSAGRVADVRHNYTAANASLGIAAAGLLAAGVSWLLQPSSSSSSASSPGVRVSLRVGPVTSLMGQF
ncbi:MAG TPA: hypothetical protein VFQ35_23625 [Polyangiaceae bacterium]|nr:hypothetical protein [Polyangiaceae bacterium]